MCHWHLGIKTILVKYCDETLQPVSRSSADLIVEELKILETNPKYEEIMNFYPIL